MRILVLVLMCVLSGCVGEQDDGWELGDELIVIWTIPRPGEEPVEEPQPDVVEPDEPDRPIDPLLDVPHEPSVSPVACDANYRSVTVPGTIEGALIRGRGQLHEVPCATAAGAEQRFRVEVPRRMGVEIWLSYRETQFPPVLLLQAGCGEDTADLYCSSPLQSHPDPYSAHIRAELDAGTYTLIVDERNLLDYGEGGAFVVHVDESELGYNAMCENADSLWPDSIGQVFEPNLGSTGDLRGCSPTGTSRHFWTVQVPPGQGYRVVAQYDDPHPSQGPHIVAARSCYGACDQVSGYGMLNLGNDTDAPIEFVIGVDDSRGLSYAVWVAATERLSSNLTCESAAMVTTGQTVRGDLLTGSMPAPFCGSDDARQLHYQIDLPPQHRLVTETSVPLGLSLGCEAGICLDRAVNQTDRTQTYTLAVGDWWGETGHFEFTPYVLPMAQNSTCAMATAIEPSGASIFGDLVSGGEPVAGCGLVHGLGFTLWYTLQIEPMTTVVVEVVADEQFASIGLEAVDSECGGACIGVHDPYLNGPGPARVELTNDQTTRKTVKLAVTSDYPRVDYQGFQIRATLR